MLAMVCTVQLMMVRMSLSMALICMVAPSHHHHRHNTTFETSHQNNQKLVNADAICPQQSDNINIEQLHIGEFNWSKSTQGQLLCSYFYGYILGIYAGGVATDRWGGRLFMLLSIGTMATTNFILPTAANTHHRALYAVRVIQGLAEALGLNAHQYLLTRWGTQQDLSLLTGLSYAGFPLGVMIIHPLVSSLCLHGPWGGWPSVFYLLGGLGAVWTLVASLFLHDSPSSHPYVTPAEIQ
ncbi:hypothetical protein Pcinc_024084 [Petrolisthes cinctipes]|uniref:Major facilitator superfamily (MFS) profile domain-containing protein n=1 Tax=Petrolisthes cinctipes TaxID=88211 RepID=A0AAE1FB98_PETCI|nr:hypothetical protein Pcinc_024084 [Petrolisthes cinctipes]